MTEHDVFFILRCVNVGLAVTAMIGQCAVWISRRDSRKPVLMTEWGFMALLFAAFYGLVESLATGVPTGTRSIIISGAMVVANVVVILPLIFPWYWKLWGERSTRRAAQKRR